MNKKDKKNILIIKANPKLNSFGEALADEYKKGAKEVGNNVKELSLRELKLERHLKDTHELQPKLSKDLLEARKLISWADHLVFTYPIWWGTAPAILKQFLETMLTPGFAFQYPPKGLPVGLMKGKSASILREEFPELKTKLPTLWTRSSFISTVGSVSLDVVKQYIDDQKGK